MHGSKRTARLGEGSQTAEGGQQNEVFPQVLSGTAVTWFNQLKPNSISGFEDLADKFVMQFIYNRKEKKTLVDLMDTKMKINESLKAFLEFFTHELKQVEVVDEKVVAKIFSDNLATNSPKDRPQQGSNGTHRARKPWEERIDDQLRWTNERHPLLFSFDKLWLNNAMIKPSSIPFVGFERSSVRPKGSITLEVTVARKSLNVEFLVVQPRLAYNVILGKNCIHRMEGVLSTLHQVMKFLSTDGRKVEFQKLKWHESLLRVEL
ncbi:hypothetical protein TIFTF001_023160 [Ficus carica]|uniref:Retrotransposon gag domain-containing protein n=1 Tax=Ficus carica TaxID=3494 RepID=A0AA88ALB9_FICCA|nr:hypothetical protein TIFTF001_023160 [Ficus carica]